MAEKLRVHNMARELGVTSKAILEKCRAEDVDLKNHMSTVSAGLAATIREWFSEGTHETSIETAQRVDLTKVRAKRRTAKKKPKADQKPERAETQTDDEAAEPSVAGDPAAPPDESQLAVAESPSPAAPETAVEEPRTVTEVAAEAHTTPQTVAPAADAPPTAEPEALPATQDEPSVGSDRLVAEAPETAAAAAPPETETTTEPSETTPPEPVKPMGPQNVPAPPVLQGPRVIRVESPEPVRSPAPRSRQRPPVRGPGRGSAPAPDFPPPSTGPGRRGRPRGGAEDDSDGRKAGRSRLHPRRTGSRNTDAGEGIREWRDQDLAERQERILQAQERGSHPRRAVESRGGAPVVAPRRSKVTLSAPIVLHEFCSATGLSMKQLLPKLMKDHGVFPNRNTTLDANMAELLALDFGIDVEVQKARTALETLEEEFSKRERPGLMSRPPVVTFLGHVDHGKTSLLDAIRKSKVAAGEAGGITQHIGAYRLDRPGGSVTFLDTPGHEAFTAMRARGAQMTDVVVLVVAADDGVMPQTIEAINHARAAKVAVVVALNKIDVPGADINRVFGQLAEHQLVPVEWGGETDVIKTSAITGEGIDALVDHLGTLSELLEIKADPTVPARATVIESEMREGMGVVARVLVQEGTLRIGDFVVCGPAAGRIRAIRDAHGKNLNEAGPSTPVEINGLDEIPDAGDPLFGVESLARAKDVSGEVHRQRREASLSRRQRPKTIEEMLTQRDANEVPELNIIVKADVQGSVDVLTKTLNEISTEEVRLSILHAGVGGITESDVVLAEASEAVIVGFHVVADPAAQRLADEKGVTVRTYRVIYELTDHIRNALEGIMTPEFRVESRGRAEVRQVFRVSNVGMVAGCLVTEGQFRRNHKVRLIRDLRVERDDAEIGSLRRFKEDVREVRSGLECGIRIANFDDVHPGDVIEAYEVVEVKRTL